MMAESQVFDEVFTSFDFDIDPHKTALLIIDMQYLDAHREFGMGATAREKGIEDVYAYYFEQVESVVIPNTRSLLSACRDRGVQVIYPRIASLVQDCRDVSLEHKRINLHAPAGSRESDILDELKPEPNDIVLSKGASGVFNATAIDQILRNLSVDTLLMTGVVTNYCVETAVRDAGDRGYNVVLVSDACAAMSDEQQQLALKILDGLYCSVRTTGEVIEELRGHDPRPTQTAC